MTQNQIKPVYILCQYSLKSEKNIDLKKFINNQISQIEKDSIKSIKFNFTSEELMHLKKIKKNFLL